jgi:hypothetical protein
VNFDIVVVMLSKGGLAIFHTQTVLKVLGFWATDLNSKGAKKKQIGRIVRD